MFFLFSKIFSFAINPLAWIVGFLFYTWLGKNEVLKRRSLKISIVLLLGFSNPFFFNEVVYLWEVPAVPVRSLPVYDAGIVLGTTLTYDAKLDIVQFTLSADRLFQAIELYNLKKIKKIIYCGGSGSVLHPEAVEGIWVKRYLVTVGIKEQDIFIEDKSNNTRENAVNAQLIVANEVPNGKYLLITSASHMRRSQACFEKVGIKVDPYSTDRLAGPRKFEITQIVPSERVIFGWYILNHELIGYFTYKLMGYI